MYLYTYKMFVLRIASVVSLKIYVFVYKYIYVYKVNIEYRPGRIISRAE